MLSKIILIIFDKEITNSYTIDYYWIIYIKFLSLQVARETIANFIAKDDYECNCACSSFSFKIS